ncbi:MAG: hypothetical protein JWR80_3029 [Bradyrhizobium sp.]|nr:hypothetical protein [Bradyrhizobium sp.]
MTPSVDERIASVVRALTDVILPSLPPEAGLAQEQVQLCVGHLQILRAQLDDAPAFEAGELADVIALGEALGSLCKGGVATGAAMTTLHGALGAGRSATTPGDVRQARVAINAGIASLVAAVSADGDDRSRSRLPRTILEHEKPRVMKDRQWFAPFGFDTLPA